MIGLMRNGSPAGTLFPEQQDSIWYYCALGCLAFIAALAIGSALDSRGGMDGAQNRPFGRVTVQIMPDGAVAPPAEIPAALKVLNATPGIASAAVLSDSDNSALVARWLGTNLSARDLPFPVLIDVKLASGAHPDLPRLQKRLAAAAPHAVVDAPRQNTAGATDISAQTLWIVVLFLGATIIAFTFSFASLVRAQIAAHRETLELLQLMGTRSARAAGLLTTRPVVTTLVASLVGTAVAAGVFSLPEFSERLGIGVNIPVPGLSLMASAWLAFIPVAAAIIAWSTGRLLAMSALRRF
jgi:cell division transport system permease protein